MTFSPRKAATALLIPAVACIGLASPAPAQRSDPELQKEWDRAREARTARAERGRDLREPEGPPPVSRGAVHRTRPPSEWPEPLPDESQPEAGQ